MPAICTPSAMIAEEASAVAATAPLGDSTSGGVLHKIIAERTGVAIGSGRAHGRRSNGAWRAAEGRPQAISAAARHSAWRIGGEATWEGCSHRAKVFISFSESSGNTEGGRKSAENSLCFIIAVLQRHPRQR